MESEMSRENTNNADASSSSTIDMRSFKERLRKQLPPDSPVLNDILAEPDFMSITMAEVLIPHYLQRLERELEKYETRGHAVLRA